MRKFVLILLLLPCLSVEARGMSIEAPPVPDSVAEYMPQSESLAEGIQEFTGKAMSVLFVDLLEARKIGIGIIGIVLLCSLLPSIAGNAKLALDLGGTFAIACSVMLQANAMIRLGADTIFEINSYGKLLLPVMAAALAARGGVSSSAALYAGTAALGGFVSNLLSAVLVPMVYLFLASATAAGALGTDILKKVRDLIKNMIGWFLRISLTVFTTYMSISGVISGTADAAALKAAKITISSMIPVVGGILSDASESVLIGAALLKNAAGIYGIFAVLAIFIRPFIQIGCHYLILKFCAFLSSISSSKQLSDMVNDYASAMGLLLAMTGAACIIQLISTVCFLKGMN